MTEFELGGQSYKMRKLSAFEGFHLSRKIAPVVPTLLPILVAMSQDESKRGDLLKMSEFLRPFTDCISSMSMEDSEFILATCLSAVKRRMGDMWTDVWNVQSRVCLFDDIQMPDMIRIVVKVLEVNLGPFISGLLTNSDSDLSQPAK